METFRFHWLSIDPIASKPDPIDWAAVTAIAALVALFGLVFVYLQAREAVRMRSLESANSILHLIDDGTIRSVRELVFRGGFAESINQRFPAPSAPVNPNELESFFQDEFAVSWEDVHCYLASLEHVSMLIVHDFAPDEIVEMYFGRLLPSQWNVFAPLIYAHRLFYDVNGGNQDFLQHLEATARLLGNGEARRILPRRGHPVRRARFSAARRNELDRLRSRQAEVSVQK